MPRQPDDEFRKRMDADIREINEDADTENEEADHEVDDSDMGCVRIKGGIDPKEFQGGEGVSFEVLPEAAPEQAKHYFDDAECFEVDDKDQEKLKDISNRHWNPELSEEDADLFYQPEPFTQMAQKMMDVTPEQDRGVVKQILNQGQGQVVPAESLVRIHYNAFHEKGKSPFDSTRLRGQEQRFQLGKGDVIPGLDLAVSTMKRDEISRFIIKPEYAFGKLGCEPRIPRNCTIMYEIELLHFVRSGDDLDGFFNMTKREQESIDFKQTLKYIRADKDAASDLFKRDMYRDAISRYLRSIKVLENMPLANAEEEHEQQNLLRILYLNVGQCFMNISTPKRTVIYAKKALYLKDDDVKALYKMGKAFRLLGDYEKARRYMERARHLKPMHKEIGEEILELERCVKNHNAIEREQCRRMFSGVGLVDSVSASGDGATNSTRETSVGVSQEFADCVQKRLQEFVNDKDLMEILAGNGARLADTELGYIIETAQKMGLLYREKRGELYLLKHNVNKSREA